MSLRLFTRVAGRKSIHRTLLGAIAIFATAIASLAADSDQSANEPSMPSYQRAPGDSTLPPQYQYQRSNKNKNNAPAPPKGEPKVSQTPPVDRKSSNRDSVTRTSATFDLQSPNAPP